MENSNQMNQWFKGYEDLIQLMSDINTSEVAEEVKTSPNDSTPDNKPNEDKDIDLAVEALNYLNQGKRHLLVSDYSSAVNSLQESCQLFDQRFGIGKEECGEAYLYYGTALLELARLEDGLFDGVVHTKLAEISEEEEEEEEEEESQDETETNDSKPEDKKTDTEEDIVDSDEDKKKLMVTETESMNSVEPQSSASASNADNNADNNTECLPSTSKSEPMAEDNVEDNAEDEASNIEVSWEVLSLAKNVFSRHLDKIENKVKLSETLQKLGEISIEWENNRNAIEILTECLTLRKEVLPEDDRLIAETYYHLGIAFSFNNDIENANNCFQSAIQVIETRVSNQRQKISTISSEDFEAIETIKREITLLEDLLPEMRAKIEDSKDQMLNVKEALQREENERIKEDAIASKNKELKVLPINDISHLIKRKRQNSGPESSPKKMCSNGHNVNNNDKTSEETAETETKTN